jgi:hypothetical protein
MTLFFIPNTFHLVEEKEVIDTFLPVPGGLDSGNRQAGSP